MLVSSITTNTWRCDGLDCPLDDQVAQVNPFFHIVVSLSSLPQTPPSEIDLCTVCIETITAPDIVALVQSVKSFPA